MARWLDCTVLLVGGFATSFDDQDRTRVRSGTLRPDTLRIWEPGLAPGVD